jgi:hypothetical protein
MKGCDSPPKTHRWQGLHIGWPGATTLFGTWFADIRATYRVRQSTRSEEGVLTPMSDCALSDIAECWSERGCVRGSVR